MLRNFSQFLQVPTTLGIPLPTLSSALPPPTPFLPSSTLLPSCPQPLILVKQVVWGTHQIQYLSSRQTVCYIGLLVHTPPTTTHPTLIPFLWFCFNTYRCFIDQLCQSETVNNLNKKQWRKISFCFFLELDYQQRSHLWCLALPPHKTMDCFSRMYHHFQMLS